VITVFYTSTDGSTRSVKLNDVTRTHESASTPTDYPAEDGADITDHIKLEPDKLSTEVFVSNSLYRAEETNMDGARETPTSVDLPGGKGANLVGFSARFDRVVSVYEELRAMQQARIVCVVATPLRRHPDMCLTRLSAPITNSSGVRFSLEFRHVRLVQTETATVPVPRNVRGNAAANAGQQALAAIAALAAITNNAVTQAGVPTRPNRSALAAALGIGD
jgi:hypothetical protein